MTPDAKYSLKFWLQVGHVSTYWIYQLLPAIVLNVFNHVIIILEIISFTFVGVQLVTLIFTEKRTLLQVIAQCSSETSLFI